MMSRHARGLDPVECRVQIPRTDELCEGTPGGIGEPGMAVTAPLANAIYAATGRRQIAFSAGANSTTQ